MNLSKETISLAEYRNKDKELLRSDDLVNLLPNDSRGFAVDIGARDGWFSKLLADKFDQVCALDLSKPSIFHPRIDCVVGDVIFLPFHDNTFKLVFCVEVLEHIPPNCLLKACSELERISQEYIIIGVPYRQDIRIARTKCGVCGRVNPPWGHRNTFSLRRLIALFPESDVRRISYVGINDRHTNSLSVLLMKLAGNPFGTYCQEEPCVYCGSKLDLPKINAIQLILAKLSFYIRKFQRPFTRSHPNWVHILFEKR